MEPRVQNSEARHKINDGAGGTTCRDVQIASSGQQAFSMQRQREFEKTSALRQQAAIDCAEDQGEIDKHTSMSM
jgi:hypothetical protein